MLKLWPVNTKVLHALFKKEWIWNSSKNSLPMKGGGGVYFFDLVISFKKIKFDTATCLNLIEELNIMYLRNCT